MAKSKRYAHVATVLLAYSAFAVPAAAQRAAGDDDPIVNSATPSTGGIGSILGNSVGTLVKGLSIEGQVRTLYESNIRRLGDGFRTVGEPLSDFRISPSVVVSNVLAVGRQQIFVEGEYGRDFYTRGRLPDRDRYGVAGGVNGRVGNFCTGALTGSFRSRQTLFSEASIQGSNLIETTNFSATANCQRPVGIGFGVSASHNESDNKDVARDIFDSRTDTFGGNLSYTLPVLGTLSVGGSYADVDYPRRSTITGTPTALTQSGDGVAIYSGNLGYRRSLGTRIFVNLGASYYVAQPKPRDVLLLVQILPPPFAPIPVPQRRDNFSGAGYLFGISYRPSPRLTADLRGSRDISQSSSVGALFVVRDSFGLDLGYNIGPSINAGVGATYDIRRYRNAFASTEERFPRVRDNIGRVYARVTYAPRRLFDVDFEVAHQRRESNPSVYDFASTSAALTLRVKFGRS